MSGGWASLGLVPDLVEAVEEKWSLPTDIQDECIPLLLGGVDVLGSASTGSGKTAAFGLPLIQLVIEYKEKELAKASSSTHETISNEKIHCSLQDRDSSIAIHPQNSARIQSRHPKEWSGIRSSVGVGFNSVGKYVWEVKILDSNGIVRVGWSSADASLVLGSDKFGFGYGGTGRKVNSNKYVEYPSKNHVVTFSEGDVMACGLNVLEGDDGSFGGEILFAKNGEWLGTAFEVPPSKQNIDSLFPTVCMKNSECQVSFDQLEFSYEGYTALELARQQSLDGLALNPRDASSVKKAMNSSSKKGPFGIIIEPTRDLAQQTHQFFQDMISRSGVNVQSSLLVGGVKPTQTVKRLEQGNVDILVGTPPITASFMQKGIIPAQDCRFYGLDEADELIGSDSLEHVKSIYARLLACSSHHEGTSQLQVCFFSATLHDPKVQKLAHTLCHRPMWVDLRGPSESSLPDTVHHWIIRVPPIESSKEASQMITDSVHRHGKLKQNTEWNNLTKAEADSERIKLAKYSALMAVLDRFVTDQILVFCRTNLDCDLLEQTLNRLGGSGLTNKYTCKVLAGMRSMGERREALNEFKQGEARILIATDVAARGIDIQELPICINFTLPDKCPETYVHRAGRVGRAQRMGLAISLVATVKERVWYCRKPNKPPCEDTRDFEKGGNCTWYSEPSFLGTILAHLKSNKVKAVTTEWPNIEIPVEVQRILDSGGYGNVEAQDNVEPELQKRLSKIELTSKEVLQTETALQNNYWKLRNKFRRR